MARTMFMAVTFMLATAVVQADQCSSGGEQPSNDERQNPVSFLQTMLEMNELDGGPSMMKNRGAMPTELDSMVRSGKTPAHLLVGAGSASARLSTCFPKAVDVCFNDCFRHSTVCKQFGDIYSKYTTFTQKSHQKLHLGYDADSRTLCIVGGDFQTRHLSTVQMIKDAVHNLDKDCKSLSQFEHKVINIGDVSACEDDMAFSAYTRMKGCKTKLIPEFGLGKWPEAGLLPDYKSLVPLLAFSGSHPATEHRCGWAGNVQMSYVRQEFARKFKHSTLFDIVTPWQNQGPGGQGGRISMQDQVTRWACFVELPARGFSGRLSYLLHSGRPILIVAADKYKFPGYPMAPLWYSHLLQPWVHYIPVSDDMSDLAEKAEFALGMTPGSNATKIAAVAQEFAQTHLSYNAAINYLADSLLELQQGS